MIQEDYVSFEVAKLLKERGFDELCLFKYLEGTRVKAGQAIDEWQNSELNYDEFSAPTHQMAMKWLREVYSLCVVIDPVVKDGDGSAGCLWAYDISKYTEPIHISDCIFELYTQAVEAALKYCLKNLI